MLPEALRHQPMSVLSQLAAFDCAQAKGTSWLIGVDEAGRGPLAGPVVAGAVAMRPEALETLASRPGLQRLNDSKQLKEKVREELYEALQKLEGEGLLIARIGQGDVATIEQKDILGATCHAMGQALQALGLELPSKDRAHADLPLFAENTSPARILVDGRPLRECACAHHAIVKGDRQSLVIAAASIIAKVTRDRLMHRLHSLHPVYNWNRNKGYGSKAHREALKIHGPTPHHRPSFLRKILATETV